MCNTHDMIHSRVTCKVWMRPMLACGALRHVVCKNVMSLVHAHSAFKCQMSGASGTWILDIHLNPNASQAPHKWMIHVTHEVSAREIATLFYIQNLIYTCLQIALPSVHLQHDPLWLFRRDILSGSGRYISSITLRCHATWNLATLGIFAREHYVTWYMIWPLSGFLLESFVGDGLVTQRVHVLRQNIHVLRGLAEKAFDASHIWAPALWKVWMCDNGVNIYACIYIYIYIYIYT